MTRGETLRTAVIVLLGAALFLATSWAQESRPAATQPTASAPAGITPTKPPAYVTADPPLPAGVLARINGRDITREEYLAFLFRRIDTDQLTDFVDDYLIREQASRLDLKVDEAVVEQLVDERIQRTIDNLYGGDRGRFESVLGQRLQTLAGYRRAQCSRLRTDMLLERCIVTERSVDDEDVKRHFERVYGAGGVQHQIRHILLLPGSSRESADAQATRLLQTLSEDPGRFVELVHKHSQDPLTRRTDGFIANYRGGMYGSEFQKVVDDLTAENQIAGPVRSTRGLHIVQLIKRTETPFDATVTAEIHAFLTTQPPTAIERARYRERLRKQARVER